MELEFDKEIDALLRKAQSGRGVLAGDTLKSHLDADGLAAFAENALPEKTRQFYTAHLADCNSCRKTLSSLILLNSEAEPVTVSPVAAPAVLGASIPWYRKLFLFPNIAYLMGSLVLVFSGFIGYSLLQNSAGLSGSEVSQVDDGQPAARGPNIGFDEPDMSQSSNKAMSAANAMNTAANSMANSAGIMANSSAANANSAPGGSGRAEEAPTNVVTSETLADRDKNLSLDGTDVTSAQPAPPPVAAAPPKERVAEDEKSDAALAKKRKDQPEDKQESRKLSEQKIMRELPRTDSRGGPAKSAGPSRNQQNTFPNQVQNDYEAPATRAVGGKKFQRKDGVWYDTGYRGQGTINVRRGTDEYRKLDSGLRAIAESLDGVVVTIWKSKTYRIQ
ncbi:MAG: hypothetical protein H7070_05335 [Saprospiraceae bacterium]|nr:hypothetical protein [Pyrinomonadaceae bacterium]